MALINVPAEPVHNKSGPNAGHHSARLSSGQRSHGDAIGSELLIAGHQPELDLETPPGDVFRGYLDMFVGYLRLYFHPGTEVLRSSDLVGVRRGGSDVVVEIPATSNPGRGDAVASLVGKVVRLEFGDRRVHSVVVASEYRDKYLILTLRDPIVDRDPDLLRVIVDAVPWVETAWIDSRGHEWREFSHVLRKADE